MEYGIICRRYCLKEEQRDTKEFIKPCFLNETIPELDDEYKAAQPYPVQPRLSPLTFLICTTE